MYPNVQADYTVVPGVSMPTDTIVTLTDAGHLPMIDIDSEGNVRGVFAHPQLAAEPAQGGFLAAIGVIAASALINAAVAGLAFHVYNKRKSAMAPAVAVGAVTAIGGVLIYALRR